MRIRLPRVLPAVALALTALLSWCAAAAAQAPVARTVLTIHWGAEDFPGTPPWTQAIREVLLSPSGPPINHYAEYLESEIFPPDVAADTLHDSIARKFANRRIDAVIANTTPALDFALEHRQALVPRRADRVRRRHACPTRSPSARWPVSRAWSAAWCSPTRWSSR